jgi:hypothetical protein
LTVLNQDGPARSGLPRCWPQKTRGADRHVLSPAISKLAVAPVGGLEQLALPARQFNGLLMRHAACPAVAATNAANVHNAAGRRRVEKNREVMANLVGSDRCSEVSG